jgi:hypothetical protein
VGGQWRDGARPRLGVAAGLGSAGEGCGRCSWTGRRGAPAEVSWRAGHMRGEVSKGVGCGIGPVQQQAETCRVLAGAGSFFFFIFIFFQKYMSILKNFENTPRSLGPGATGVMSPKQRATGPQCIFFLNLQRGPWPGVGGLSPPNGRQGFSHPI